MNKETGKQAWVAPKLEQISMVDTSIKPGGDNEGSPSAMPMFTGNQGVS